MSSNTVLVRSVPIFLLAFLFASFLSFFYSLGSPFRRSPPRPPFYAYVLARRKKDCTRANLDMKFFDRRKETGRDKCTYSLLRLSTRFLTIAIRIFNRGKIGKVIWEEAFEWEETE